MWSGAIALGLLTLLSPAAIAQAPEGREPGVEAVDSDATGSNAVDVDAAADPAAIEPPEAEAVDASAADANTAEASDVAPDAIDADTVDDADAEASETPPSDAVGEPPGTDAADITAPDAATPDATAESDATVPDTTEPDAAVPANPDAATPDADTADIVPEEPTADTDTAETEEDPEAAAEEAAQQRRLELFAEGDRLFEAGQYLEAEERYRQAKGSFEGETVELAEPITNPEQLPPAGQVYWREYQAGLESGLDTRIDIPLQLLTQEVPEFIPGHLSYVERLQQQDQPEAALAVLERATTLYPDNLTLTQARIDALIEQEEWLQAAIAARQFALINPDDPAAEELAAAADDYQDRFRRRMRSRITRNAIGNVLAGSVGFALTGNIFGPLSALQTSILLLRGEAAVGERAARQATEELEMITDEPVLAYVNDLGEELAEFGGRSEFEYEFYVVAEDELNAFALPGGKVFINAGAILDTETTAELAGLIAHELSHALLSHGFQLMTGGNLMANVMQVVPYGGIATNLAVLSYSRDMERQADRLGTRILAASPYAADGMARLMRTLDEENPRGSFDWLSTHPDTPERIRRLETLIEENGYNRYAYEGVEEHQRIQDRVRRILIQAGVLLELDENGEPIEPEVEGTSDAETGADVDADAAEAATDVEQDATPEPNLSPAQ